MSSTSYGHGAIDLSSLIRSQGTDSSNYAVTTENFAIAVLKKSESSLVIVDLGSPQSSFSTQLSATLAELAKKANGDWLLAQVDCGISPEIPAAFNIRSVPTIIAVYKVKPVSVFEGSLDSAEILSWINDTLKKIGMQTMPEPEEHPGFLAAQTALLHSNFTEALEHTDKILHDEPHNEVAKQLQKNIQFLNHAQKLPPDSVVIAQNDKTNIHAHYDAADYLIAKGNIEQAFELLIAAIIANKFHTENVQKLKEHLFELFSLFESDDPAVKNARTILSNALF